MPDLRTREQIDAFLSGGPTNMIGQAAAQAPTGTVAAPFQLPSNLTPAEVGALGGGRFKTQADIDAFLDRPDTAPISTPGGTVMGEAGRVAQGVGSIVKGLPFDPEAYRQKNEMPGVPLDSQGGGPAWLRAKVALIPDKEGKLKYLQGELGSQQVREDNRGGFIIRENRPGGPVDISLDEYRLSFSDLGELFSEAGFQTLGAGLFTKIASLSPLLKGAMQKAPIVSRAVTSSVGAGAGELVREQLVVEPMLGLPVKWKDSLRNAGTEAALNLGFDMGLATAGKGIMRLVSPLGRRPSKAAIDGVAAEKFFMESGEITEPLLTLAERTGSPGLINAQTVSGAFPWGRRKIEGVVEESMKRKLALQDSFAGVGPDAVFKSQQGLLDALEPVGGEMKRVIHERLAFPVRQAAIDEAQRVINDATTRITGQVLPATKPFQASSALQRDAEIKVLQYRNTRDELYADAKALIGGGTEDVVPIGDLSARASEWVEKNAPSFKQVVEKDTGLVDEAGKALTVTEEQRKYLDVFAPRAVKIARELSSIPQETALSLDHLISMRNTIDDGIKEIRAAVPDLDTRDFISLRGEMTKTIHEGIAKLGPEAKAAYDKAEGFVRETAPKFQLPGVEKLYHQDPNPVEWLRDVMRVSTDDRANQVYYAAREFYGEASPQWEMIKSTIRDDMLSRSLDVDGRIDGKTFVGSLLQFSRTNKQVFDEVFGDAPKLAAEARKAWAGSIFLEKGKITPEDATAILSGSSTKDLDGLMVAQLKADQALRSDIMKKLASGEAGGIPPEKFVSSFINDADNQTVREVMGKLQTTNPEMVEAVERSVLVDLFRKAGRAPDRRFPPTAGQAWQLADPDSLSQLMSVNSEKLQAALSPATLEKLDQFRAVLNAGTISDTAGGAGRLASGGDAARVLKFPAEGGGLFGALHRNANALILASLLTSKTVEKWFGNHAMRALPENEKWAMLFYLTPAITEQLGQYGEEEAAVIGQALNESMARTMRFQQLMGAGHGP